MPRRWASCTDPIVIIAGDLNVPRAALVREIRHMTVEEDTDLIAMNEGTLYVITDAEL